MPINEFNSVKLRKPNRNVFDLSHDVKLSLDMGWLVPTLVMDCVPGDHFTIGCDSLLRFAPLVAPVMHRFDVYMHYFFVPNRILWPGWEDYITGNADLTHPYIVFDETMYDATPLVDYMGLPRPQDAGGVGGRINAFPFAAYQAIYNELYRDQDLQGEIAYELLDGAQGPNQDALVTMRRRSWQHDYFTSARPFAQKGEAVELPVGVLQDMEVKRNLPISTDLTTEWPGTLEPSGTTTNLIADNLQSANPELEIGKLYAEVGNLASTTINDLRTAIRLQEWLERNAVAGTRYKENILAHFGVRSSDARLDRPEYITGTKSPVIVSEVLNTTGTVDAPQGNMSGHAVSVTNGRYGKYFCEEHGYIIGIMSVMPLPAYQQGIPRHFNREDRFDYFWPTFAHIGEQEIKQKEIFLGDVVDQDNTFGYAPRYSEYKFMSSRVAGDFRTTLDFWHMGRIFDPLSPPALNSAFIECDPGKRIFAVQSEENSLYAQVLHRIRALRPLPKFSTPTL